MTTLPPARGASRQDAGAPLVVSPCRRLCDWSTVGSGLFACTGCGSQWRRGQGWTPRQADGSLPAGIAEELRRPADAAGSADS